MATTRWTTRRLLIGLAVVVAVTVAAISFLTPCLTGSW
jgi:preprotein translocase subunit SecE